MYSIRTRDLQQRVCSALTERSGADELSGQRRPQLEAFVRAITLVRGQVEHFDRYPFNIPAIRSLETLELHPQVTFLVGENGSGKSTLVEAIAIAAGFNAEGGSRNFNFSSRRSESELHTALRLVRGVRRPKTGYFLRAESYYNVATEIERLDAEPSVASRIGPAYGPRSLHEQSHGESFLALIQNRFSMNGFYVLDEPEAALSPQRQLSFLVSMHELVNGGNSQFVVATHSPIILAYPGATIYTLRPEGINTTKYEDTEQFSLTRDFLVNREQYLRRLLRDPTPQGRSP
jgi:predicted ATPase